MPAAVQHTSQHGSHRRQFGQPPASSHNVARQKELPLHSIPAVQRGMMGKPCKQKRAALILKQVLSNTLETTFLTFILVGILQKYT